MSAAPLLDVRGVGKRFGGLQALARVSFSAAAGEIVGIIGPNGAGKTTLFNVITGFYPPDTGQVLVRGVDVTGEPSHRICRRGVARTFQLSKPFANLTVLQTVRIGALNRAPDMAEATARALAVLERVALARKRDQLGRHLTVVERKRLELARALAIEPRLLLLDEVLAGLNPSEIRDMVPVIRAIRDRGVTIVMIEHVMQAVMSLAEQVFVLSEGRIIAEGSPHAIASDPRVVEAYLGHGAARRMTAAGTAHA
jgi:branched-chain amino acid transport system ATP-binding protein